MVSWARRGRGLAGELSLTPRNSLLGGEETPFEGAGSGPVRFLCLAWFSVCVVSSHRPNQDSLVCLSHLFVPFVEALQVKGFPITSEAKMHRPFDFPRSTSPTFRPCLVMDTGEFCRRNEVSAFTLQFQCSRKNCVPESLGSGAHHCGLSPL